VNDLTLFLIGAYFGGSIVAYRTASIFNDSKVEATAIALMWPLTIFLF
jgi:hypothetical protein